MQNTKRALFRFLTAYSLIVVAIIIFAAVQLVRNEVKTSKYQARYLSQISQQLSYTLTPGKSPSVRFPAYGPYDERLGYTLLPHVIDKLKGAGFHVAAKASLSPMLTELVDYGLFPVYHEKNQAGLTILDRSNQPIFTTVYPKYGYPSFQAIPPVILNTLLFIENRELLSQQNNTVNPAVEWDRFGYAGLQLIAHKLGAMGSVPGGSTLATQIEKYRHSPHGYTNSITDKFRQMGTASVKAYLLGQDTRAMRQEIVLSYLNSMPLSATPRYGEVHGLGDGLKAWFNSDFAEINKLLSDRALSSPNITHQQAQAYRQVLNLLLSQRRPSYLLGRGFDALQILTDQYLRLMVEQGIISERLRDASLGQMTQRPPKPVPLPHKFVSDKKTQSVLRSRLADALDIKSNYDLDRLDLTVKTTLDYQVQQEVSKQLHLLNQPDQALAAGIIGKRMLNANVDMSPIVYSLLLYERGESGNLLRVQTDNYDQPLDINEGIRLDLGSTSKLRTMVHYLELVNEVYQNHQGKSAKELSQIALHPRDHISEWVVGQLKANPKTSLEALMDRALEKKYSANPGEAFFTGGGVHTFANFSKTDNYKNLTVNEALRDSVNLVFIRMMRDLVYYHLYKPDGLARWLENPDDPKRLEYLHRFADREGSVYLQRFYSRYRGKTGDQAFDMLVNRIGHTTAKLSMLFRAVYPNADEQAFSKFLSKHLDKSVIAKLDVYYLYDKYSKDTFDLQDQGYITKIHPLELWLVGYLVEHPNPSRKEILEASREQRLEVYRWLLKSNKKLAQQRRIMTMLETEAFTKIHKAWQRTGYPFASLTPSYATSIGASGDRPAALAELVGILRNDGVRLPAIRFDSLHFAQGTPYETVLKKSPANGERIFPVELAQAARNAMVGVVQGGTASRLKGVYVGADGKPLAVGGKTGTGDHRKEIWGKGHRLIESKFISRTAVFTFFLGERFFGVITAYVEGENAGDYQFTSSVPVQILKFLKPALMPLILKPKLIPLGS